jgi:hypothetical protein
MHGAPPAPDANQDANNRQITPGVTGRARRGGWSRGFLAMSKRLTASYRSGPSRDWIKVKNR